MKKNLPISGESLGLFELNEKLKLARQRGCILNQTNKLTIKIYSNLQSIIMCYYLKHCIPMCHRLFFRRISQKKNILKTFAMIYIILFILRVENGI